MQLREFELRFRLSRYKSLGRGASTADIHSFSPSTRANTRKLIHWNLCTKLPTGRSNKRGSKRKTKKERRSFGRRASMGERRKKGDSIWAESLFKRIRREWMEEDSVDLYSVCLLQERSSSRWRSSARSFGSRLTRTWWSGGRMSPATRFAFHRKWWAWRSSPPAPASQIWSPAW